MGGGGGGEVEKFALFADVKTPLQRVETRGREGGKAAQKFQTGGYGKKKDISGLCVLVQLLRRHKTTNKDEKLLHILRRRGGRVR